MITKVVLAKLSPTMEEGTIVKWSKQEGDAIKVGDVLAEIETDKANMEMEALGNGVLRKVLVPAGGKAPVGALIGVIADPAEDIAPMLAEAAAAATAAAPAAPAPVAPLAPAPAAPVAVAAPSPPPGTSPQSASYPAVTRCLPAPCWQRRLSAVRKGRVRTKSAPARSNKPCRTSDTTTYRRMSLTPIR